MASFTPGKKTRWTHPATSPTVARAGPVAGVRSGSAAVRWCQLTSGVRLSICCSRRGSSFKSPLLRTSQRSPLLA